MIASLKGVLTRKELDRVVVEVGGVGYLVHLSAQTLASLPGSGQPVELLCHTHVREDAIQIFGFQRAVEQSVFELLIQVSGIGPRLALTVLSGMAVGELIGCITGGDTRQLQTIPGIGRKTAERIVLELKDRCAGLQGEPGALPRPTASLPPSGRAAGEVVEALVNLGYKRGLAERAVERTLQGEAAPLEREALLRQALASIREG